MSRRTSEASKAIREAWEREQNLVSEGKGTRDWTPEQQKDILDPNKGKAYDENGRAYEGQHMRSAAEYPELQGNPDNIQFLTREEHLEAHKGSWQNPTNWYYDPVTKDFFDFGEGEIIPCKVIELSDPIAIQVAAEGVVENNTDNINERTEGDKQLTERPASASVDSQKRAAEKTAPPSKSIPTAIPKKENGFVKGLKSVGRFIVNHPVESLEIAGVVIGGVAKAVSAISSSRGGNNSTASTSTRTTSSSPATSNIATQVSDIIEKATRAENDVSAHRQRYHYKDGSVKWVDKSSYHRGGKD